MAHQNVKNDKKQKKFFLCPKKPITKAFESTAAGVYDFRRLKTGRSGGLWGKALLAPGFCPNWIVSDGLVQAQRCRCPFGGTTWRTYPAEPFPVSRNLHHLSRLPCQTAPGVPESAPPAA